MSQQNDKNTLLKKVVFAEGIYHEHLEEASFLCGQRCVQFCNNECSWIDIGELEERLDAHIYGLIVGGESALEVCRRLVMDGDAGDNWLEHLVSVLKSQPESVDQALARLWERYSPPPFLTLQEHSDDAVCAAEILALLRGGNVQVVENCSCNVAENVWQAIPLALAAGHSAVSVLVNIARSDRLNSDILLALGILGDSSVLEILLAALGSEFAESAALSLNLITGADIYEQIFIDEKIDEDELVPEELVVYQRDGSVPTKSDGTPFGEWITRVTQHEAVWLEWLSVHGKRFKQGVRYRNGLPFSPSSLLQSLQHEKTPYWLRQLAFEELVIRYNIDSKFEADMLVREQLVAITEITQWLSVNKSRFEDGKWYFAGQIVAEPRF